MRPQSLKKSHKNYLWALLIIFAVISATQIGISYTSDPFRIHGWENEAESYDGMDLFWYLRFHKPYRIGELKPSQIVIGSSRSARFSPSFLQSKPGQSSYNASLPGATMYEVRRHLEHANQFSKLEAVIVGIDHAMVLGPGPHQPSKSGPKQLNEYNDSRLLGPAMTLPDQFRHYWQLYLDYWVSLYSRVSLTTLLDNALSEVPSQRSFNSDGTWFTTSRSQSVSFLYAMISANKFDQYHEFSLQLDWIPLDELVEFAGTNDIDLVFVISPLHAHIMNAIEIAGAWESYLEFQRQLAEKVSDYQKQGISVKLLGFEHSKILTQPAPDGPQNLFEDGIHLDVTGGDALMPCIISRESSECLSSRSPRQLNPENIEAYLELVSHNMESYRAARPVWYAQLKSQLQKRIDW
jgi:hypothetical protein